MRTLFTVILLLFTSLSLKAQTQDIYSLLKNAEKYVSIYDFQKEGTYNLDTTLNYSHFQNGSLKQISDALETTGFCYNPVNDTLLIEMFFFDSAVFMGPGSVFIQSSASKKNILRTYNENNDYTYQEYISNERDNENFYTLVYTGDITALKKRFIGNINPLASGNIAIRIVLKDGKITYPSLVYYY